MESIHDLLEANKKERARIVLKQFFKIESLTADVDAYVLIQGKPTLVEIQSFCMIHSKTQKNLMVFVILKI